jgi:hypothetical protein
MSSGYTCNQSSFDPGEIVFAKLLDDRFTNGPFGVISAEIIEKINLKPQT